MIKDEKILNQVIDAYAYTQDEQGHETDEDEIDTIVIGLSDALVALSKI